MCSDRGDAQVPPSVAFSPGHPTLSIEIWRDDVVRSTAVGWEEGHPRSDEDGQTLEVRSLFLEKWLALRNWGQRSRRTSVAVCHCSRQRRSGF